MYFCGNKKKSAAFSTKHYYIFANFYFAHCPQNCTIDARSIHLWIKAPQSLQNTFLIPWRPTFPVTEHVNNEEIKVRLRLMSGLGSYFAKWAIKLHGHQIRLMRLGWISFEMPMLLGFCFSAKYEITTWPRILILSHWLWLLFTPTLVFLMGGKQKRAWWWIMFMIEKTALCHKTIIS